MPSNEFKDWWTSFRVTGDICPLRLGMTRDEVKAILGEPDDVGYTSRKHRIPAIWRYEDLEFHFAGGGLGPNATLSLIYRERNGIATTSISVIYAEEPGR